VIVEKASDFRVERRFPLAAVGLPPSDLRNPHLGAPQPTRSAGPGTPAAPDASDRSIAPHDL
jgi:hypothetical protein